MTRSPPRLGIETSEWRALHSPRRAGSAHYRGVFCQAASNGNRTNCLTGRVCLDTLREKRERCHRHNDNGRALRKPSLCWTLALRLNEAPGYPHPSPCKRGQSVRRLVSLPDLGGKSGEVSGGCEPSRLVRQAKPIVNLTLTL